MFVRLGFEETFSYEKFFFLFYETLCLELDEFIYRVAPKLSFRPKTTRTRGDFRWNSLGKLDC
jgi:hypothetical protein